MPCVISTVCNFFFHVISSLYSILCLMFFFLGSFCQGWFFEHDSCWKYPMTSIWVWVIGHSMTGRTGLNLDVLLAILCLSLHWDIWCLLYFFVVKDRQPFKSSVIGRPVLVALEDVDGAPSFLEKALRFIEEYGGSCSFHYCLGSYFSGTLKCDFWEVNYCLIASEY